MSKIKVTGCQDCPLNKHHYGHGENWDYCSHPDSPSGYGNTLSPFYNPNWCPLKSKAYKIELIKSTNNTKLTENQLEKLKNQISKHLHKPYRDMVDEFLSYYALTDEAAYALYEHVQQQTGLSKEEIVGED